MSSNINQVYTANPVTTFVATDLMYLGRSPYGATDDAAFVYSDLIPLDTKGDLFTYGTTNSALAVGATDGQILQVLSSAGTGLSWSTASYPSAAASRGGLLYGETSGNWTDLPGNIVSSKKYLQSLGNGVLAGLPNWAAIDGADITGYALTKTDDTNVTLTLGGSPTTALINAASITAGWTGVLSNARGGTGQTTYTDGQILVGNTGTNSLDLVTISDTVNQITVTNGPGTILLSLPQDIATTSSPTFESFTLSGSAPQSVFYESDAALDNKRWQTSVDSESWTFSVTNDGNTIGVNVMTVERTGTTVDSIAFNSTAMTQTGTFTAVGNISADAGTTSTVLSAEGSIEITSLLPFIDFKTAEASDFDTRIIQNSNGLDFLTGGNGTSNLALNISAAQEVTMPLQPAFFGFLNTSTLNATGNGGAYQLGTSGVALTEVFDQGGDFNTNGTFTAPVTGRYRFEAATHIIGTSVATEAHILLVTTTRTYYLNTDGRTASAAKWGISGSVLANLTAGDTAFIRIAVFGEAANTDTIFGDGGAAYTYFSGNLVC